MTAIPYAWCGANAEHPLDLHSPHIRPSPAVPRRNGFRQGSASRAYHALPEPPVRTHPRTPLITGAGEVLRVPEASSNLNSFLR